MTHITCRLTAKNLYQLRNLTLGNRVFFLPLPFLCIKSTSLPKHSVLLQVIAPSGLGFMMITHTHIHPFNGPFSRTTRVGRYQKGKTNLDFIEAEARDSEWQWHRLDHMQVCTSLQTDNHASTSTLSFLQAGRPSCRPANSVKALKAL